MGTHYRGTAQEQLALEVFIKLTRAAESVGQRINGHLSAVNLTVSQFGVLEALFHLGPMHQKDLGEKILKSSGNMTLVIDNLGKRGLVQRERDPRDRRCYLVTLTPVGEALISDLFPRHVAIVTREIGALNPAEQEQLATLCRKLGLGAPAAQ
jgi:MarR family 2-MHQ and catechol resistance regulon transcriptional repressor